MRTSYLAYQDRLPILQSLTAKFAARPNVPSRTARLAGSPVFESLIEESGTAAKSQSLTDQLAVAPKAEPRKFTLSWTHYLFLTGIKNPEERDFYEIEAAIQNWTVRELKRQFDSSL